MATNVTNSISADKLAEYQKKKAEYDKKVAEQQKNVKAKQEEAQKANAKKAEAAQLGEALAKGVTAYTTKEYKKETLVALNAKVKELKEDGIDGNELTEEQIKLAKKYIEGKEFKKAREAELKSYAQNTVGNAMSQNTTATSGRDVQKAVKGDYNAQLKQLKDDFDAVEKQYKKNEITKEKFEAKKETYNDETDRLKLLKKNSGGTRGFWQALGFKKNEANKQSDVVAKMNKKDKVQGDLTSKDEQTRTETHMNRFSVELQAKINESGFTTEELIEIYENNGGYADATVNYSYNKNDDGQIGERKGLLTSLNANKNGYKFTEDDVKAIGKALGYDVENAINWGKVAIDAGKGAVIGAPAVIGVSNSATALAGAGSAAATAKNTVVLPVGSAIGLVTGGVTSAVTQYKRVEDKAIPEDIYEGVTTYDEYCKRLKDNTTEEGYRLGSQIAKFYDFGEDGFNVKELEAALHKSAGTVEADKTPLNYEEARGLLIKLQRGEIKPAKPEPEIVEEPKTEEFVTIVQEDKKAVVKNPGCEYKIKYGDNPYEIAVGLYGLGNDHKTALKVARYIKSMAKETDGKSIFWKVGTSVNFPETIPGITDKDGNPVIVDCNGTVKAGKIAKNGRYKYASSGTSNDLGTSEINWQEYQARKMKKENGKLVKGDKIGQSHLNRGGAEGEIESYKNKNKNKNHEVIVVK